MFGDSSEKKISYLDIFLHMKIDLWSLGHDVKMNVTSDYVTVLFNSLYGVLVLKLVLENWSFLLFWMNRG